MTSLPSLVFISPLTLFNRKCKLKDKFPNEIQHQELEYVFTIKKMQFSQLNDPTPIHLLSPVQADTMR